MYAAVYTARAHEHLQSRVRAVYMARVYGCVLAVYTAAYGPCRTVYSAVYYTARVDEHVHGCVWDVYTTVYMARYGRVGLPAMYTTVYWLCTRTCTWHVQGLLTAV